MASQTTEAKSDPVKCLTNEGKGAMKQIKRAICNNDLELLEQLLDKKTPKFCGKALYLAVKKGIQDNIEICNDETMSDDDFEEAARCADNKNAKIVELLLRHGADCNLSIGKYFNYTTVLGYACGRASLSVIKLMIDFGADVSLNGGSDRNAAIRMAFESTSRSNNEDVVNYFLSIANSENINKWHLLHLYILNNLDDSQTEEHAIARLLQIGADINKLNDDGYTVLNCSTVRHNTKCVEFLIRNGADVNLDDNGRTALTLSISRGHNDLSEYLVKRMILMKAQGFNVSDVNLNAAKAKKELENFQNECDREMGLLTSKVFDDSNLSYHDILMIKNVCRLASLASNENIVKVIKSEKFVQEFPNYGPLIVQHFDKGILENRDFQLLTRFINYLSSRNHDQLPKLPFIVISEIFNYLNAEDVAKLREL